MSTLKINVHGKTLTKMEEYTSVYLISFSEPQFNSQSKYMLTCVDTEGTGAFAPQSNSEKKKKGGGKTHNKTITNEEKKRGKEDREREKKTLYDQLLHSPNNNLMNLS